MFANGAYIEVGEVRCPIQHLPISCSSIGDNPLVPAVAGKVIRLVRFTMISASAVNGKLRSNTTDLTGAMPLASGLAGADSVYGHVDTAVGQALNLNLSGAVAVAGYLSYITF